MKQFNSKLEARPMFAEGLHSITRVVASAFAQVRLEIETCRLFPVNRHVIVA